MEVLHDALGTVYNVGEHSLVTFDAAVERRSSRTDETAGTPRRLGERETARGIEGGARKRSLCGRALA